MSPILNETNGQQASATQWNAAQRRGTNSLTIGLDAPPPSSTGNGLAIA
jgi:hypothetical protein